jgi:hypothetical protein
MNRRGSSRIYPYIIEIIPPFYDVLNEVSLIFRVLAKLLSKFTEDVTFLTCILECSVQFSVGTPTIFTQIIHGFL